MNRTTKIAGLVIEWEIERTGERNLDGNIWIEGRNHESGTASEVGQSNGASPTPKPEAV